MNWMWTNLEAPPPPYHRFPSILRMLFSQGGHRAWVLDADSSPPPWKLGGKCRTIGAKGTVSNFCLMWQRVKMCFHPICLYSIYLEFLGEFNSGQKLALFN